MTMRLSASSFAGTARTLVAVGTVSDCCMFLAIAAAAPRSVLRSSSFFAGFAGAALAASFGEGFAAGRAVLLAGAADPAASLLLFVVCCTVFLPLRGWSPLAPAVAEPPLGAGAALEFLLVSVLDVPSVVPVSPWAPLFCVGL